jgi:4-hydroxy-tetrahydrodipicolinate reductase
MGRVIAAIVAENGEFAIDQDSGDVLIDFSAPAALPSSLERARSAAVPLLVGTTGLDELARERVSQAARDVPIVLAANTSLGVALLCDLAERAARVLGSEWDVDIAEIHHRRKADAPSGTALALGEAVARGRNEPLVMESARFGTGLKRVPGAIGFAALRGGTVAGDHDVYFLGEEERIILSHRAESRAVFARGAVAAARFLIGRAPGLYSMADVVRTA